MTIEHETLEQLEADYDDFITADNAARRRTVMAVLHWLIDLGLIAIMFAVYFLTLRGVIGLLELIATWCALALMLVAENYSYHSNYNR